MTKIAGAEAFSFLESGFMSLAPTSRLTAGPIIFPQKLPIRTLKVRKGKAKIIKHIHRRDQNPSHTKPKVNLRMKEIGPIFFLSTILNN